MSWKWFFIGAASVVPFILMVMLHFLVPVGVLAIYLGFLSSLIVACMTNCGKGLWTYEGYSHSLQGPWPIAPIRRPRLGGFATGYCTASVLTALTGLYLSTY